MEGTVPLPLLVERADRVNAMLDSSHLPDEDIGSFSKVASEKVIPFRAYSSGLELASGGRRRQSMAFTSGRELENPYGSAKAKFLKRPISPNKIKILVGVFVFVLLILVGIVVGVTVGRKHKHPPRCPANRTGNACNLGR